MWKRKREQTMMNPTHVKLNPTPSNNSVDHKHQDPKNYPRYQHLNRNPPQQHHQFDPNNNPRQHLENSKSSQNNSQHPSRLNPSNSSLPNKTSQLYPCPPLKPHKIPDTTATVVCKYKIKNAASNANCLYAKRQIPTLGTYFKPTLNQTH